MKVFKSMVFCYKLLKLPLQNHPFPPCHVGKIPLKFKCSIHLFCSFHPVWNSISTRFFSSHFTSFSRKKFLCKKKSFFVGTWQNKSDEEISCNLSSKKQSHKSGIEKKLFLDFSSMLFLLNSFFSESIRRLLQTKIAL